MRKIVTHFNPDLDAVVSAWLIVRWLPGWRKATFRFVPAGKTFDGRIVDSDPNVLHVDTGLGKLDHHQSSEYSCAAKLTLAYVKAQNAKLKTTSENSKLKINKLDHKQELKWNNEALERLVEIVRQIDNFQEVFFPESLSDRYEFSVESILDGLKLLYREQDKIVLQIGLDLIDGVYISLLSKVEAETELVEKGEEFESSFGKGLAIETKNSTAVDLAQKKGYKIVVCKHPVLGHIRIKIRPANFIGSLKVTAQAKLDRVPLQAVYAKLKEEDPGASWFLHSSGKLLLNGSSKNPKMKATKLSLEEVVKIIQSIDVT